MSLSSRRLPIGAEPLAEGVHFRVWAPNCRTIDLVLIEDGVNQGAAAKERAVVPLRAEPEGYFSGLVSEASVGSLYRYRLNGGDAFPDPASRSQPLGVHGPSQVIDPHLFPWTDAGWKGLSLEGQVFYELHVGTFTREGTWKAAEAQLSRLAAIGVTAIELMPVAEFAGEFGWGYDGVDLFAPYRMYGTPDDMRRFVDRAHAAGLGVILDVVYNHFGPDGCYQGAYSSHYIHHEKTSTGWGDALNFDGPHCEPVREYFIANAGYWIDEFHLDGLRLDATQAIHDQSEIHLLAEISRHARAKAPGRRILLVAENEPQDVRLIRPFEEGGYGLDALWNDDFHHSTRVSLTGHSEAYYCDYRGSAQELLSAVRHSFLFQGQFCKWQQKLRGTSTRGIPASRFITYLENHDQLANSARGFRLKAMSDPGRYRAMVALWLLAPQTPMLFQGQELGTSRPFVYFSDHHDDLAKLVREGRREELSAFRSTTHPEQLAFMADASARQSFLDSKLDDPANDETNPTFLLFRDLLRLRREDPIIRTQNAARIDGALIGPDAFAVRYFGEADDCRLLLINLGNDLYPTPNSEPLLAPPAGAEWKVVWFSEHPRYGGSGIPPFEPGCPWRLSGRCAVLMAPVPSPNWSAVHAIGSAHGEDYDIHPFVRQQRRKEG